MNKHRPIATLATVAALAFFTVASIPRASAGDQLDALSAEDQAFANRFLAFLQQVDDMAFGRTAQMNGTEVSENLNMSNDHADYDIRVARGPVVEKIGRTRSITKKTTRPFEQPSLWSRYYLIDVHPKSPLVGMLHAAIVVQFHVDGGSTIAGFLDVLETAHHEEDLAYIRQAMDAVFAKHNVDPAPHRRLSRKGHDEDDPLSVDNSKRRKTTMVGGSFYGNPLRTVNEENFKFMTEAYETMLDAYLTVVERRADDPYTAADLEAQDRMRKNWFEDRFFSDPYTSSVTPYEAWSLYSLPPTVKF